MENIEEGLTLLHQATDLRLGITSMYQKYKQLSIVLQNAVPTVTHKEIKTAVDAIHYLGGVGYPHPNSPGRMEDLLDKVIGMYRVLDFIGRGKLVKTYLGGHGVSIKLDDEHKLKDGPLPAGTLEALHAVCEAWAIKEPRNLKTVAQLYEWAIDNLSDLQGQICSNSNVIRKELKPEIMQTLSLEREEVKRSLQDVKLSKAEHRERVNKRRKNSTESYKTYLAVSRKVGKES